jgi:hypothetical protein
LDTEKYNAEIQDLKDKIETAKADMEEACKEFLKATEEFTAGWYQESVKSGLTENAKAALELGTEGLKKLKSELNDLIARLPDLVENLVNTGKWPHRNELPADSSRKFGISIVKELSNNYLHDYVQKLFGHVGALLIKHGLADSNWDMKPGDDLPTYKVAVIWSEKMDEALRKYADVCDKWINLDNDLKKVEKKKTEAEISELWDKL